MLLALSWWAILLYKKTQIIHELKIEQFEKYPNASEEFERQSLMIKGEGIAFAISLIIGIIILNAAFRLEIKAAKQQKNFLLSVTHELKSPITAILLILETFKKRKLSEEQSKNLIENAREETERLKKLVEDLLLATRINPKSKLKKQTINLSQIIEPLLDQYIKNHPNFHFKLIKEGSNFEIDSNESSIYLILSNLIDNAVKYSDEGTSIEVKLYNKNGKTNINVADQGRGIPSKELDNIFNQFYRIGDENVRSTKGTGLGLYLVKELCAKLKIIITVYTNSPKGTIFELQFPHKNKL